MRIILLFIILNMLCSFVYAEEFEAVVIKNFPPHYTTNAIGKPDGFAIDTFEKIAETAGIKYKYRVFENWTDVWDYLETCRKCMIPNVGITDNRGKILDFTIPLETFVISVYVRTSTANVHDVSDLKDKKIAVLGTNVGIKLVKKFKNAGVNSFKTLESAIFSLLSGESDALIFPVVIMEKALKETGLEHKIKNTGIILSEVKRSVGIAKGNEAELKKLNDAAIKYIKSDHYKKTYVKWFSGVEKKDSETKYTIYFVILLVSMFASVLVIIYFIRSGRTVKPENHEATSEEKFFSDLFKNVDSYVYAIDAKTLEIVYCSNNLIELTGEEFIGKTCHNALMDMDNPCDFCRIDKMEKDKVYTHEFYYKGIGKYFLITERLMDWHDGTLVKFNSAIDVTDSRKSESNFIKKEEWFYSFFESSHVGMAIISPDFEFILSNKWIIEDLGVPISLIYERKFTDYIYEEDLNTVTSMLENAVKENISNFTMDIRLVSADHSIVYTQTSFTVYTDKDNQLDFIALIINDITERVSVENELKTNRDVLQKVNAELEKKVQVEAEKRVVNEQIIFEQKKFADIGDIMSAIAHQWRQPLNALGLNIQLITELYDFEELDEKQLSEITKKCLALIKYMSSTIDNFRDYFSPQECPEEFDINKIVKDSLNSIESLFYKSKTTCSFYSNCDNPVMVGYRNEISLTLLNVISNSLYAIKKHIEDEEIEKGEVVLEINCAQDNIIINVSDNGPGIPMVYQKRVFEPYFSTKSEGEGKGLGLYFAKMVVEKHMKGTINLVKSEIGTNIEITIPRKL